MFSRQSFIPAWNGFAFALTRWTRCLDALHASLAKDAKAPNTLSIASRADMRAADEAFKFLTKTWKTLNDSIR